MTMRSNPVIKLLAIPLIIVVAGIALLAHVTRVAAPDNPAANRKSAVIQDNASSDTPVETLKTLTAEMSAVEQQNRKIIEQNKALSEQDKTTLAQFKSEVLSDVQQQMEAFKNEARQTLETPKRALATDKPAEMTLHNKAAAPLRDNPITWVSDMQAVSVSDRVNRLPNPPDAALEDTSPLLPTAIAEGNQKALAPVPGLLKKPPRGRSTSRIPYYTIPVNATLTGAIAMQPIIGRIPLHGKVPDPYTFKVIIGPKNLAANGIDIPEDIQGIVASGIAEGDLLGRCARGDIYSLTFVFQNGRISTTQVKEGQRLGTIAAANGNPCLSGAFHTDAPLFLGASVSLAGLQGASNALSQAQVNNVVTPTGTTLSTLLGSAPRYALGQGFSAAAQAAQKWWEQRVDNSFDFIYVPNIDAKTGEKLMLNINITQEISIDDDPQQRKVFYTPEEKRQRQSLD